MRVTWWLALACAASVTTARAAPRSPPGRPPEVLTRERMEAALPGVEAWRFVYGTRDPATSPLLQGRALLLARRLFGADSSQVVADSVMTEAQLARGPVLLLGSPRENLWTARWSARLPLRFTPRGFMWQGTSYEQPGDLIHLVYPHPLAPRQFLLLVAGNSPRALTRRAGGFYFGGEDWRIYRDGELARSGRFAQGSGTPWRYDAALDDDREAERRRFAASLVPTRSKAITVLSSPELRSAGAASRVRARADELVRRVGGSAGPLRVVLYADLEQKGEFTGSTRPEHWAAEDATVHLALPAGQDLADLWTVAAARAFGMSPPATPEWEQAAGTWLAGAWDGEPLAVSVSRLWFARLWPDCAEAAAHDLEWRSPRRMVPARAILCGALERTGGRAALLRGLRSGAGGLDSLARVARVPVRRLADAYQSLADSMARAGMTRARAEVPPPPPTSPPFERGVCLAHSVEVRSGYLSAAGSSALREVKALGASAVSLTPFGYLPSPSTPEIHPSAMGGPDEESDESLAEAAARAHALDLRVQLKPHLWTRGWVGALDFGSPAGWKRFFAAYREFILHHALLAQRHRIESLCVGHELRSATAGHEEEWRGLIAAVRRVYGGTLVYGANWDEVEQVPFWDQLDQIGVSGYFPLAEKPTRDVRALRASADRELVKLEMVARRFRKPVLLAEVGYPALRTAPVRPWEEAPGPADPESQRACYAALVEALEGRPWVSGVFWWKWPTGEEGRGPGDASYSPRGKPARAEMERAFAKWKVRRVGAPG
jgi:hypothetical protein